MVDCTSAKPFWVIGCFKEKNPSKSLVFVDSFKVSYSINLFIFPVTIMYFYEPLKPALPRSLPRTMHQRRSSSSQVF